MNGQNPPGKTNNTSYGLQKPPAYVVKEPEVICETKQDLDFKEDFNRALTMALTPKEFLQDMYDFIDSLPWKGK